MPITATPKILTGGYGLNAKIGRTGIKIKGLI
jgi:hypothetical protein